MLQLVTRCAAGALALGLLVGGCSSKEDSKAPAAPNGTSGAPPVAVPDAGINPVEGAAGAGAMEGESCAELSGLAECGVTTVAADIRTVNILLLIDKSGSMTDQPVGFDANKWSALRTALEEALGNVKADINFGLLMYPFSSTQTIPEVCKEGCCAVPEGADAVNVDIDSGSVTVPRILNALEATSPGGGTPTAAALQRANEYFTTGAGAGLQGNSYVLLATDGGPNCNASNSCGAERCTPNLDNQCNSGNCCKSSGEYCLDDHEVTRQIEALKANGIPTFVVGIPGTEAYAPYLEEFAKAGGVANPTAPPQYYAVSASGGVRGLVDVFTGITTKLVRSCEITLSTDPPNVNEVNLAVDCEVVRPTADDGSGWELDTSTAPNKVLLKGALCEQVERDGVRRIDVVYGCPTIR
ncbi:MAG TPA: vWA domain-containing protein [Polyangiaceae bacterium]|nr:vWA domain-containing protein [Polyangiaceae bacterium]